MTSCVDMDDDYSLGFDVEELANILLEAVMDYEQCPYESTVNLLVTDSQVVRQMNLEHRNIDNTTDVLSFPAIEFETPGDFSVINEDESFWFEPDTGELLLGDIVINVEKVFSQADEYGHSVKREFAFLMTHSLFHLCGYDHLLPEEAVQMEARQKHVLESLGITRE